jgi:outer membrane protein assembly factor BamB
MMALALSCRSKGSPDAGAAPGTAATSPTTATAPAAAGIAIGWRNDGSGSFPDAAPVKNWDEQKKLNIIWTAKVGKLSYASPIVVGDRVLVTAEPAQLVCLDAKSGKPLWEKSNGPDQVPPEPKKEEAPTEAGPAPEEEGIGAGNAAATPVSDGKYVWAEFATDIVACYDLDGNRKWIKHFEHFENKPLQYGHSSSPVLAAGKLILNIDCTIAVDPATGKELWRQPKASESRGTPVVGKLADMEVLLTCSGYLLRLKDGAVLNKKLPSLSYSSPILQGDVAYFAGASRFASAYKLTPGGPDVVTAKQLWESDMGDGDCFASPVISEGMLFAANDYGLLSVFDAKGVTIYTKRLKLPHQPGGPPEALAEGATQKASEGPSENPADIGHIYPSLAVAGKNVFIGSDSGDMVIIESAKEYKEVGQGKLATGSGAAPFFAADRIFARSGDNLCCIGHAP